MPSFHLLGKIPKLIALLEFFFLSWFKDFKIDSFDSLVFIFTCMIIDNLL